MIPNMYGVKKMRIARFIVQETGTYNTQYRRPFEAEMNADDRNLILETIDRAKSITPLTMAGVANAIITPPATPESQIMIPNGWSTRRLRFFLEVVTEDRTGLMQTSEYIVGYTDHCGAINGYLDPKMVFFINAVNITRTQTRETPLGTQVHHNLIDASHVLVNNDYQGIYHQNQIYTMRPEDVYDHIDHRELAMGLDGFAMDGRTKLTGNATKSQRVNGIASAYMADLLNSYLQVSRDGTQADQRTMLQNARMTVESATVSSDPFMSFIRGKYGMTGGDHFTYRDLVDLDPGVEQIKYVAPVDQMQRGMMHYTGQTADWGSSDLTTQAATVLAQSVPGYLLQFGINKIRLFSTNMDLGMNVTTRIGDAKSFNSGEDLSRNIQAFLFRLENELLKNISMSNGISFSLELVCDLLGETWITLGLNGEPPTCYVTPSFCDALMAPVVTSNYMVLNAMANDFDTLMQDVVDRDSTIRYNSAARAGVL
ncbi:MAG: hypothetical protein PHQ58_04310 [Rhodoferax sp.]|uniref:hypothetical protein n=1 Tax=Rhodoferax sp. TaxID=50421 RepID=UPI00262BF964|nr:hypothetical protein [Rhodoferax sp.]MDD2879638.1 hypothetical protein [Rhodoferax sp.]